MDDRIIHIMAESATLKRRMNTNNQRNRKSRNNPQFLNVSENAIHRIQSSIHHIFTIFVCCTAKTTGQVEDSHETQPQSIKQNITKEKIREERKNF